MFLSEYRVHGKRGFIARARILNPIGPRARAATSFMLLLLLLLLVFLLLFSTAATAAIAVPVNYLPTQTSADVMYELGQELTRYE